MTDTTRNWHAVRRQGWNLSKARKGSYQHFTLTNPKGEGVASILNTGYYPLSAIFDWATRKVAEMGVKHE